MRLQRQSNGQLITLDPAFALGTGGEARVYAIPQEPSLVAKVYHEPTDDRARKLMVMLAHPPNNLLAAQEYVSIAWPVDLLLTTDRRHQCVGFLMPYMTGVHPIIEVYNPRTRRQKHPRFDYFHLHHTARNLAAVVHALHARGYVIADVKQSNIFVTDTALVALVDTDSFQVYDRRSGIVYRCLVGTPEFTPPELQGQRFTDTDRAPEHDFFGVAVIIFQLLMEGMHPFDGLFQGGGDPPPYEARIAAGYFPYSRERQGPFHPRPTALPFEILHPTLQRLFRCCFEDGHHTPKARPDAQAWRMALDAAKDHLITCPVNDQHRYGDHLSACPWCKRAGQLGGYDSFPSRQTGQHGKHAQSTVIRQTPLSPIRTPRQQARLLQTFTKMPTLTQQVTRPQRPNHWAWTALMFTRLAVVVGHRFGAGRLAMRCGFMGWRRALSSARYGKGMVATAIGLAGITVLMVLLPIATFRIDNIHIRALTGPSTTVRTADPARGDQILASGRTDYTAHLRELSTKALQDTPSQEVKQHQPGQTRTPRSVTSSPDTEEAIHVDAPPYTLLSPRGDSRAISFPTHPRAEGTRSSPPPSSTGGDRESMPSQVRPESPPWAVADYLKEARKLYEKRQYNRALDACEQALKFDPANAEVLRLRDQISIVIMLLNPSNPVQPGRDEMSP